VRWLFPKNIELTYELEKAFIKHKKLLEFSFFVSLRSMRNGQFYSKRDIQNYFEWTLIRRVFEVVVNNQFTATLFGCSEDFLTKKFREYEKTPMDYFFRWDTEEQSYREISRLDFIS
jgi:hypothetical protein